MVFPAARRVTVLPPTPTPLQRYVTSACLARAPQSGVCTGWFALLALNILSAVSVSLPSQWSAVPTKQEAFDFYLSMKKSVKEGEKAVLSGERRRARYVAPGRFLSDYAWAASGNTLDAGHAHWTAKVTADPRFSGDIKPAAARK